MKKRYIEVMVFCRLWHDDKTKRTYHLHVCDDDSDVLTWGVADL